MALPSPRRRGAVAVFRVTRDGLLPGARVGDVLVVRPGADRPAVLQRETRPNYWRLLDAARTGALVPLQDGGAALALLERGAHESGGH